MVISRVVVDGRIEKVEPIDPGPPLLHSRYEWSTRYRKNLLLDVLTYTVLLLVVLSLVGIVLYMVVLDETLVVFIIVLAVICFLLAEFWPRGILGRKLAPGLYQEGFIHPKGFLLPYEELRGVRIKGSSIPLFPERLVFQPHHENRFVDYSEWDIAKRILGGDGIKVLEERISAVNEMTEG